MLWTYAPLETLDRARQPRSVCGTRRRGLKMDRLRRGNPLFRSAGTRSREDLHYQQPDARRFRAVRPHVGPGRVRVQEERGTGTQLRSVLDYFAASRADLLRRRRRQCASDRGTQPQTGSDHHLASERQASRGSRTGRDAIRTASLGPRYLRPRRDHHGSNDGRISEHRQRHLLRAAAVRLVAPAPEALARPFRQPDPPIGR